MDDDTMEEEEAPLNRGSDWIRALDIGRHISTLEREKYRDLSFNANWSLSSCKVDGDGFGITELLSDSVEHYWQSDGPQPHSVTVEFPRKTDICFVAIYLDFKSDESYTPSKIIVRLGSSLMHLDESKEMSFTDPVGWQIVDVRRASAPTRAFVVQLQVLHNHQNGRDTHIRHMRVIGPSRPRYDSMARSLLNAPLPLPSNVHGDWEDEMLREDRENIPRRIRPDRERVRRVQDESELSLPIMPVTSLSRHLKRMTVIR